MKASILSIFVLFLVNMTLSYLLQTYLNMNPDYILLVLIISSLCWPYNFRKNEEPVEKKNDNETSDRHE